ncbi:MAG: transcription-repair coupling factor [Clostridiales bacterium]|nr:transcription-repair coupling factor [Clostridiales bacterium]
MEFLSSVISSLNEYKALYKSIKSNRITAVSGTSGVHKANIVSSLCKDFGTGAIIITGDETEANTLCSDIKAMGVDAEFYPVRDFVLRETVGASREYEHQRLKALSLIKNGKGKPYVIVTCVDAFCQYTIPPSVLHSASVTLKAELNISPGELVRALVLNGYEACETVEGPGQFAHRGGIVDIFVPDCENPVRVEFWGDEIDSINYFDTETQRRTDYVEEIVISPSNEVLIEDYNLLADKIEEKASTLKGKFSEKAKEVLISQAKQIRGGAYPEYADKYISFIYKTPATLLNYLREDNMVFISENSRVKERMRVYMKMQEENIKDYFADGTLCSGLDKFDINYSELLDALSKRRTVFLDNFTHGTFDIPIKDMISFTANRLSRWSGSVKVLTEDLLPIVERDLLCVVLAGTEKAAVNLTNELKERGIDAKFDRDPPRLIPGTVIICPGSLSAGIEYPARGFTLISHGQTDVKTKRRSLKASNSKNSRQIGSLSELVAGDYIVHSAHGIGIYNGIHKISTQGVVKDYIKISYAKGDTLYVPVTQLDLVSKYIGPRENNSVKLNRLGGTEWQRSKATVKKAVKEMAKELTALYAERMKAKGFAFSEDTEWQRDFEAKFEYTETEDQLRCAEEIKSDMQRTAPMDRLLCGDVGFGKTEVALRAAFKCVSDSKQCAILVPTTILAWQHYQTVLKRFEGFPVRVELLSRFRSAAEQAKVIEDLKLGRIDIIIGTHRLVQNDIKFYDLGLVIIDEEQRFGVAQKEKLKQMQSNVDVLTLSATPIPRTLNMAMSGIRDMSVIEEAPMDRYPVQTYVMEYDKGVIGEAIRKELRRGGQVFFLHNDVDTIQQRAFQLSQQIPEAKVAFAHGKMNDKELSDVWREMVDQEINVLVCTTIMETGVDIPNANTLIIEKADCLGLSQLHQLRGRVGRSTRRAYAYLTFYKNKVLTDIAEKRLSAIREFTEFGSGFKIAMRDLELRGAGNVLGASQHGHMEDVGYDMYLKLLNEALCEEKGEEPPDSGEDCFVDLHIQAHIPEEYIQSAATRIDIYRRIADIRSQDDADDVTDELVDRFGEPPYAVMGLINIALIRNFASGLGIYEIKQIADRLMLYIKNIKCGAVERIMRENKYRALLNAGNKPYISVKLEQNGKPLEMLKKILSF